MMLSKILKLEKEINYLVLYFYFNVNNINSLIGVLGGLITLIKIKRLEIFWGYGKQTKNLSNFYSASNLLKSIKESLDVIIIVLN